LIDQPLMRNVLADLALESEAATALFMRVARTIDQSAGDAAAAALKRIGTALAKYYVCKRTPGVVAEALECLGGNGYVEESVMPRLYREAPLNSIWEGSGNINALDVVRVLRKQPDAFEAWRDEIEPARGDARIARELGRLEAQVRDGALGESEARSTSERMALLWQGALLRQFAPESVAEAFLVSRIETPAGRTLGTLPPTIDFGPIVERAAGRPAPA
jgi:putative acyl-CoA dehydrogenase